jgi:pimeloyl-ACP methyl ester carboxylesterase
MAAIAGAVSTFRANGIDLCVETFGDPSSKPLVLIMGLGAQMIVWPDLFCADLAAQGFFVIRFDNRDIGQSTWLTHLGVPNTMALLGRIALRLPITVPYTLRDMAADVVGLLDVLKIERAHVAGASMGGMIGQELAINFPERLLTLTSIMSSTGDPKLPPATAEATAILFAQSPTEQDGYIKHYIQVMQVLRGPHFPEETPGDLARSERVFSRGINPGGVARQFAAILASGNRTKKLATVKTPTLVIHGDADPLIRIEGGKRTAAAIAGAKLTIIPKMGHSLPQAVWPAIIDAMVVHAA